MAYNNRLRLRSITCFFCAPAPKYALGLTTGLACLLWFGALAARAADRYVSPPGGYGTNDTAGGYTNWAGAATNIQWAVDKAGAAETIWVTNGTYYLTNQIYITKGTLSSVNGMEKTFINGNYPAYSNRCFSISGSAVVKGFTIMNAYYVIVSSGINGGGVFMSGGTLGNCHVTTNFGDRGGGIHISGGRMYDCIISSNACSGTGAGLYATGTDAIISNCIFRANVSGYRGGGISFNNGAQAVINCAFISNSAVNAGGGICAGGANNIFRNCLFVGNSSWGGGIIELGAVNTKIQNCTFTRNSDSGLHRYDASGGLVENCIFASNSYIPTASTTSLNNRTESTITVGAVNINNITNNTSFVSYAADNFRLAANSPCINRGTNEAWMTNAVDLDGKMRIRYGAVDMGAYERINEGAVFGFH